MGDQVTVRLPADLSRALRAAAKRSQRKSSEIVRMALREFLRSPRNRPSDRVRDLIGSLESGIPDLATKQRAFILESLKNRT